MTAEADRPRGTDATLESLGMDTRERETPTLPPEGEPLTAEQRKAVIARLRGHMAAHKITQRDVAVGIDYASTTLSSVLSGEYRGDSDRVLRAVASWIEDDLVARGQQRPIGFYETAVFRAIQTIAHYAKSNALRESDLGSRATTADRPRIAIGYGPAGCGKTVGGRAYTLYDPRAIYLRMGEHTRRVASLSVELYRAIVGSRARPQTSAARDCVDALRGSQRLLIIDEGHTMTHAACEYVRTLCDVTGIPIVILATQEFHDRITRVRRRDGVYQYDQFSSRVGLVVDLLRGADGHGGARRAYYSLEEIAQIFARERVRYSPDALEMLQAIACTVGLGMLRTAAASADKAARAAIRRHNGRITADLVLSALESCLIPAGSRDEELTQRVRSQLAVNRRWADAPTARATA